MIEHSASRSLRSGSAGELHESMVADLIAGEVEWLKDPRDLMMALAPFHDCGRRLGLDVPATFRAAAEEGPASLRNEVTQFGERRDVTPDAFGYAIVDGPDGLSYRYV